MDHKYQQQLEYYQYYEKQKENPIDLSLYSDDPNNCMELFAKTLFSTPENNLNENLTGMLIDESMDILDLFSGLIELLLYGYDILTGKNILTLGECTDDILYTMKSYFNSCGFDIDFDEVFVPDMDDISLYRDKEDYYCEILHKPPKYMCMGGWYILDYRIICNNKFQMNNMGLLEHLKAFFITKQNKIFTIKFKYIRAS